MKTIRTALVISLAALLLCAGCGSSDPAPDTSEKNSTESSQTVASSASSAAEPTSSTVETFEAWAQLADGTVFNSSAERVDEIGYLIDAENVVEFPFTVSWKTAGKQYSMEIGSDITVGELCEANGLAEIPLSGSISENGDMYKKPGTPYEMDPNAKLMDYMAGFTLECDGATEICINGVPVVTDETALAGADLLGALGNPWCVKVVEFVQTKETIAESNIGIYEWRLPDGGKLVISQFSVAYVGPDMF